MKNLLLLVAVVISFVMCSEDESMAIVEDPIDNQNQDPNQNPPPPPPPPALTFPAPCENGLAGGLYPCQGIDLIYHIDLDTLGAQRGNDCWGWTDPTTGNEYAIMGLDNGTAFIDISDPEAPVFVGKLNTETVASSWRDVKVYENHAFIVSEAMNHGMQVFDLTSLRDVTNPPFDFRADAVYKGFGSAHNIVINEESGFAYAVGTSTFNGGPHFVNIQNPTSPIAAGGYAMGSYSHDAQVVTYSGPDTDHTGKEILIGSNENKIVIVDISDKANPRAISEISYNQVGYTHQGWFTEDQKHFIVGDELDEIQFGIQARTLVFNFEDLDNPTLLSQYLGTPAIDHNGYVKGNSYYLSNYSAGLRVLSLSGIDSGNLSETAFFDTFPSSDQATFSGAWSVYPYFESDHIIISDINTGFYLVK